MYIYEVSIHVDKDISADFDQWLNEHIKDMLNLPVFSSAQCFVHENEDLSQDSRVVHYYLRDSKAYQEYIEVYAKQMRAEGLEKFADHFTISRRYLVQK